MPSISEQLPNLMNGVSQQAVTMRMASQCEEQLNAISSIVDGNVKRPPLEHVAKLPLETAKDSLVHTINRDIDERYKLVFDGSGVRAFDLTGNEIPVNAPGGTGYLGTNSPQTSIRALTVADYTFIVNRNIEVEVDPELTPEFPNEALIFVEEVVVHGRLMVYIDGEEVSDVPLSESAKGRNIEDIIADIVEDIENEHPGEYEMTEVPPVIHIRKVDGAPLKLKVQSSRSRRIFSLIKNKVQRFTDLPVAGKDGYVVEILGDQSGDRSDKVYYVKFVVDEEGEEFGNGYWQETVAPGIKHKLRADTMPHTLVREADGTFTFKEAEWGSREAGDLVSAEWPSFVGQTINYVYLDRRRLCFLTGNGVAMSRARNLFNFFPETSTTLLDENPINVVAPGTSVADLISSQSFERKVVLFSEQKQFIIDDDYLIASQPPAIKEVSSYEASQVSLPVSAGRMIYLPTQRGRWAGVLEYYTMSDTDTTDATNISEHVPQYIPAPITSMSAAGTGQMVLVLTKAEPESIYVYKYHWRGNEKLQSSWSKWTTPPGSFVLSAAFINSVCYALVEYDDGVYLHSIDLGPTGGTGGEDFTFCLDRRIAEADVVDMTYDPFGNTTSFTLPYKAYSDVVVATRRGDGTSDTLPGTTPGIRAVEDALGDRTRVTVAGDLRNAFFYVGHAYAHLYTFSEPVMTTSSGTGGRASVVAGRLQLMRWNVVYDKTGYIRLEVHHPGREDPFTSSYTPIILGRASAKLGEIGLGSGVAAVSVRGRSDRVRITAINDSFTPSAFTAAEWEGQFTRRTSRV